MTFQGSGKLDTSQISGGGSGRGGGGGAGGRIALGGGAGLLLTLVALFLGVNPMILGGVEAGLQHSSQPGGTNTEDPQLQEHINSCTIEMANTDDTCRIVATTNSVHQVWSQLLPNYTQPATRIFSGSVATGCGPASSEMGPFYCPADQTAYFDPTFFAELKQMGGSDGPLSQEYVVAHEFGHHVENLTGVLAKGQRMGNEGSVRIELQADCLAGVWAYHADKGPNAMLEPLTDEQIATVIQTAKAIGDDTIQGAHSNPESWTHGSAEQRQRWFKTGYSQGDRTMCDTFATNDL